MGGAAPLLPALPLAGGAGLAMPLGPAGGFALGPGGHLLVA
jgi:hypothetical protein